MTCDVLWIFGLPPQGQQEELRGWLEVDASRLLMIAEEREEVLLAAHLTLGTHPQVRVVQVEEEESLKQLCWEAVLRKSDYRFSLDCSKERRGVGEKFFAQAAHYQRGIDLLASDYSDLGVAVLRNTLTNLKRPSVRSGISLKDQFQGVPAIICGAGPSLTAHVESLSTGALLFAGGSAIQALSAFSVRPHFIASIDPDPPYERFFEGTAFEIPFLYQNRLSARLLPLVQGELLCFPDNGGHGWEKVLLEEDLEPFAGGWTVATFCAAVAVHLGCSPIIFLGVDLSFSSECYAKGVTSGTPHEGVITVGENLFSKRDWVLSAEWLSDLAAANPQCSFLNASSGGLPIAGVDNIPFEKIQGYLNPSLDLEALVHAAVQQSSFFSSQVQKENEAVKGLERIDELCSRLLAICEKLHPQMPFDNGEYTLFEMDLEEEGLYQNVCLPIWNVWQYLLPKATPFHLNRWLFLKRLCHVYLNELKDSNSETRESVLPQRTTPICV